MSSTRRFLSRAAGAALAQIETYEGIREDPESLPQAVGILVFLSSLGAIGTFLDEGTSALEAAFTLLAAWLGWAMQFALLYIIGKRMRREVEEPPTIAQVVSTVTFSYSAAIFMLVVLLPYIGPVLGVAAALWYGVAYVVSIRAAFVFRKLWDAIVLAVVCAIVLVLPEILVLAILLQNR